MTQSKKLSWVGLTAVSASIFLFLVPIGLVYDINLVSAAFIVPFLLLLGWAGLYASGQFRMPSRSGFGAIMLGAAVWEVGWVLMILVDKQFGWAVFMAGWLLLSAGLFMLGMANIQRAYLPRWIVMLLTVGFVPALAEVANPYFFASIPAVSQIGLMLVYSFGWVLLGKALSAFPYAQPRVAPVNRMPVQPRGLSAHGTD